VDEDGAVLWEEVVEGVLWEEVAEGVLAVVVVEGEDSYLLIKVAIVMKGEEFIYVSN
jgi:hypothetical protein